MAVFKLDKIIWLRLKNRNPNLSLNCHSCVAGEREWLCTGGGGISISATSKIKATDGKMG